MHELSLADEILRLVEEAATREGFSRVAQLRLEVGALAGVETAALRFALDALVRGTCLEGAEITLDDVPGSAWCAHCAASVPVAHRGEPCPQCGAYPLTINGGGELRVADLVVMDDDDDPEENDDVR